MKSFALLVGCIAFVTAQIEIPIPRWEGPLANHVIGQTPPDTPEVAAAKSHHKNFYSEVEAQLPVLPPEIRYQKGQVVEQHIQPELPAQPIQPVQPVHHVQPQAYETQAVNYATNPPPALAVTERIVYAEEIPRSPIGEVPEVHAARVAHLKLHQQLNAILPRLADVTSTPVPQIRAPVQPVPAPVYNPVPQYNPYAQNAQFIMDTPEVAAAKAEHARAVAASG